MRRENVSQLTKEKYSERVNVVKYSITFSGSAIAFLITAKTKLDLNITPFDLKILLALWGTSIFTGFGEYILSYREVWYHPFLPDGIRKRFVPKLEIVLLYIALVIHPFATFTAILFSVIALWRAFP